MIIAPKIEIYTQLVCRSIDPVKSGVILPAPISAFPGIGEEGKDDNGVVVPPRVPIDDGVRDGKARWKIDEGEIMLTFVDHPPSSSALSRPELDAETLSRDDTWAKQCRGSAVVQKEVIRLVSS